jgi:hypothetical protein
MNSTNNTKRVNGSIQAAPTPEVPTSSPVPSSNDFISINNKSSAFAPGASGPSLPPLSLPSGGGSIRGIGENIAMNTAQGTVSFNIPLNLSPSRQGSKPKISLQYDSGGGGGVWGIGWNLSSVIDVTRRTRLGLPRYEDDGEREDVFIISGAEDLVPVYLQDYKGKLVPVPGSLESSKEEYMLDKKSIAGFTVRQYRP